MTDDARPLDGAKRAALQRLVEIVARLRGPDGCPWDRKQTTETMAPFLLEEAHELVEAIERRDDDAVAEEIGDVVMVCFLIAQIGEDEGRFDLARSATHIADKLVRRHPHVFGDATFASRAELNRSWEAIKAQERREKGERTPSALDGVPGSLPALQRAYRLGEKAAAVGFEWPDLEGPTAKIHEELDELLEAVRDHDEGHDRIRDELGDVLFSVVNLARHLRIDPESALRRTIERFTRRFRHVEANLGKPPTEATLDEMEQLWQQAKDA